MKTNTILIFLSVCLLCSCSNKKSTKETDTPEALQNDGSLGGAILSKRSYDNDLVNELYTELAKKTPQLAELENRINLLEESQSDSIENFNKFNQKNTIYYGSADSKVNQIKDSVLREKIKFMIKESLSKYDKSVIKQKDLLAQIEKNNVTLNDLHLVLKITKTLPAIEKYQSTNRPSNKPINGFLIEQHTAIILADTLIKK
jgi:hypothetical protein